MSFINLEKKENFILKGEIQISGSKSLSNRLLILKNLYSNIEIKNFSDAEDTITLKNALASLEVSSKKTLLQKINIGHCGTAMRFLTSYFAALEGKEVELSGSARMSKRPIGELVEALNQLGASICYLGEVGYPPLRIKGKKLQGGQIELDATVSSQFVSSLMMLGPSFRDGLKIFLKGEMVSLPYLQMTFSLLKEIGAQVSWEGNTICIRPGVAKSKKEFLVESDWSSVSYYYLIASLSRDCNLVLSTYEKKSIQGDSKLIEVYEKYFGIKTSFEGNKIKLTKNHKFILPKFLEFDLNDNPDLAQSIVVNCAASKIKCKLKGLSTLVIKETDRLKALKNELKKIGVKAFRTKDSFEILDFEEKQASEIFINTYEDHRMAMAFAALALIYPLRIENPEVVKKSYPNFWKDLRFLGFQCK